LLRPLSEDQRYAVLMKPPVDWWESFLDPIHVPWQVLYRLITYSQDPLSRRNIWDIIQNGRANRTLLITTHYLDEVFPVPTCDISGRYAAD
jgi:hypothetical protein